MSEDPGLPEGLLETLIDIGNKALNDYYHERACACDTWPGKCATWKRPGDMFFGMFDTDAFAIGLPDVVRALIGIIVDHLEDDDFLIVNTDEIRESLESLLRDREFPALVLAEESGGTCHDPVECGHEAAAGEATALLKKHHGELAEALNCSPDSSWDYLTALVTNRINALSEQRDDSDASLNRINRILHSAGNEYPVGPQGVEDVVRQRDGYLEDLQEARDTIRGLEEEAGTLLKDRNRWRRATEEIGRLYSDCENQRDAAREELVRLRAERDTYYGALVAAAPAAARMIRTAFEDGS